MTNNWFFSGQVTLNYPQTTRYIQTLTHSGVAPEALWMLRDRKKGQHFTWVNKCENVIYLLPQSIFNSLCDLLKRVLQLLDMTRRSRHGQAQEFGLSLWTGEASFSLKVGVVAHEILVTGQKSMVLGFDFFLFGAGLELRTWTCQYLSQILAGASLSHLSTSVLSESFSSCSCSKLICIFKSRTFFKFNPHSLHLWSLIFTTRTFFLTWPSIIESMSFSSQDFEAWISLTILFLSENDSVFWLQVAPVLCCTVYCTVQCDDMWWWGQMVVTSHRLGGREWALSERSLLLSESFDRI